jgi:hypothetical protein
MIIFYKNKGLLIILYLIVCFIGSAILVGVLHRNTNGIFSNIDFYTTIGIGFLLTSIWTYLTKDDFYMDREGKKKKMDTPNELFWISMKVWAFIFFGASLIFLGNLIFEYFEPLTVK